MRRKNRHIGSMPADARNYTGMGSLERRALISIVISMLPRILHARTARESASETGCRKFRTARRHPVSHSLLGGLERTTRRFSNAYS